MAKLKLNRETLTELTTGELSSMAAGVILTPVVYTLPLDHCVQADVALTYNGCLSLKCPSQPPTCYCTPIIF